jgi:hypothetical protein
MSPTEQLAGNTPSIALNDFSKPKLFYKCCQQITDGNLVTNPNFLYALKLALILWSILQVVFSTFAYTPW